MEARRPGGLLQKFRLEVVDFGPENTSGDTEDWLDLGHIVRTHLPICTDVQTWAMIKKHQCQGRHPIIQLEPKDGENEIIYDCSRIE